MKEEREQPQQESLRGSRGTTAVIRGNLKEKKCGNEEVVRSTDGEKSDKPAKDNEENRNNGGGRREREAFLACTRRNHETMSLFLQEVTRQGLHYTLVYQATLDADTALFVYNEIHLPIKVYKITLPQDQGTDMEAEDTGAS